MIQCLLAAQEGRSRNPSGDHSQLFRFLSKAIPSPISVTGRHYLICQFLETCIAAQRVEQGINFNNVNDTGLFV
jgi:hypothetical protein